MVLEGKKIGPYLLEELIGSGGMGMVYRAIDTRQSKTVAFKVLLREELSSHDCLAEARRLRDEAKAAAKARHSGLMACLDAGDDKYVGPYVVYEFFQGKSLRAVIDERGALPLDEAIECVARPLLQGLEKLHELGVIHRDIKPENLFQREDGTYALGDFGLALFEGRQAKTRTGIIVGTPGYVAPEILMGSEVASPASDIYSAAVTITEILIGSLPFGENGEDFLLKSQLTAMNSPQELVCRGIPPDLAPALAKALHQRVQERFSSAEDFWVALENAQLERIPGATVQVVSPPSPKRSVFNTTKRLLQQWRWRLMSFFLFALALCAAVTLVVHLNQKGEPHQLRQRSYVEFVTERRADRQLSCDELDEILVRTGRLLGKSNRVDLPAYLWQETLSELEKLLGSHSPEYNAILARAEISAKNFRRASHFWKEALDSQLVVLKKLNGQSPTTGKSNDQPTVLPSKQIVRAEAELRKWAYLLIRFVTNQKVSARERREAIVASMVYMRQCPLAIYLSKSGEGLQLFHFLLWAYTVVRDGDQAAFEDVDFALRNLVFPHFLKRECQKSYLTLLHNVKLAYANRGAKAPPALGLRLRTKAAYLNHLENWRNSWTIQRKKTLTLTAKVGKAMEEDFYRMHFVRSKLSIHSRLYLKPLRQSAWVAYAISVLSNESNDERQAMSTFRAVHRMQFFEKESPTYKELAKDGQSWSIGFGANEVIELCVDRVLAIVRILESKDMALQEQISNEYMAWFSLGEVVRMNVGAFEAFYEKLYENMEALSDDSPTKQFFYGYRFGRSNEMDKAIERFERLWRTCLKLASAYCLNSLDRFGEPLGHHIGWLVNDSAFYYLEALKRAGDDKRRIEFAQKILNELNSPELSLLKKTLHWKYTKRMAIVHWGDGASNNEREFAKVRPLLQAVETSRINYSPVGINYSERAKSVLSGGTFPGQSFGASPLLGIYRKFEGKGKASQ